MTDTEATSTEIEPNSTSNTTDANISPEASTETECSLAEVTQRLEICQNKLK